VVKIAGTFWMKIGCPTVWGLGTKHNKFEYRIKRKTRNAHGSRETVRGGIVKGIVLSGTVSFRSYLLKLLGIAGKMRLC
jgi:hypothetical protein